MNTESLFKLWLEFEETQPLQDDDPEDDFANIEVRLPNGLRYALNVWTFGFMRRARFPWPYEIGVGEPDEYLLPPDLFVERLDGPTMERVIGQMIREGEMRAEWLCPDEEL